MATDIKRLQWNIVLLVVCCLLGAAAVVYSLKFIEAANKTRATATSAQNEARSKLARANDEAEELREKIIRFQTLDKRGVIGEEHRLDWIEQIRRIEKERKLFALDYELAPQQAIDKNVATPSGNGVDALSSPMKLKLPLLDENDLLNLYADLSSRVQGYVRLDRCSISRLTIPPTDRGPSPQLQADCNLDWITLREKK